MHQKVELTSQLLTVRASLHQAEARCAELEVLLQAADKHKRALQEAREAQVGATVTLQPAHSPQDAQLHALQLERDRAVALADATQHARLQADAAAAMVVPLETPSRSPSHASLPPSSPGAPADPPLSARLRLEQELAARQEQVERLMAVVRAMGDEAAAAAEVSKQLAGARQEAAESRARLTYVPCSCMMPVCALITRLCCSVFTRVCVCINIHCVSSSSVLNAELEEARQAAAVAASAQGAAKAACTQWQREAQQLQVRQ